MVVFRMRKNEIIAIILIILATVGTVLGIFAIEKYRRTKFYTLELIARSPNNGNWYPREFKVPYGKEVKILIRNIETVSHGFAIPDLEVAVGEIKAGEVAVVRFTPSKKGTFPFMCTVWCSDEHLQMTGEITVE
jgi:heme/copper-type cytochrome/quinol oxidase subunit 2